MRRLLSLECSASLGLNALIPYRLTEIFFEPFRVGFRLIEFFLVRWLLHNLFQFYESLLAARIASGVALSIGAVSTLTPPVNRSIPQLELPCQADRRERTGRQILSKAETVFFLGCRHVER